MNIINILGECLDNYVGVIKLAQLSYCSTTTCGMIN